MGRWIQPPSKTSTGPGVCPSRGRQRVASPDCSPSRDWLSWIGREIDPNLRPETQLRVRTGRKDSRSALPGGSEQTVLDSAVADEHGPRAISHLTVLHGPFTPTPQTRRSLDPRGAVARVVFTAEAIGWIA